MCVRLSVCVCVCVCVSVCLWGLLSVDLYPFCVAFFVRCPLNYQQFNRSKKSGPFIKTKLERKAGMDLPREVETILIHCTV